MLELKDFHFSLWLVVTAMYVYIIEFEQNGNDRTKYGTSLLSNIAKKIGIKGLTSPELSRCRQFYKAYPGLLGQ